MSLINDIKIYFRMMFNYKPKTFWNELLTNSFDLKGVGHYRLSNEENLKMYEDKKTILKTEMEKAGIKVEIVSNGEEAIDAALHKNYDLILMDIQMPEMDGFEATKLIRQNDVRAPIIALTAHALSEQRERALAQGFTDYLTKPISREKLLSTIRDHTLHKTDEKSF